MIIYLAGLQGIPSDLYEAAQVDGAGTLRQFWSITIPMLSPVIFFNVIMGIIGALQVFTQAYVMTNGGPHDASLFFILNLYRNAFEYFKMGYASALAWVLFVYIMALTLLVIRSSAAWVYYEGRTRGR
jgi:multiple sugar transport system permease protein